MPVLPKSLVLFGASLATRRTARALARPGRDPARQQAVLRTLTARLARTAYGRSVGIEPGLPYATFRTRVPVVDHDGIAGHVERSRGGEPDVLAPGPCPAFALTAGTTTGQPRPVPLPAAMLQHFQESCRQALLFYTARTRRLDILQGRHLALGGDRPPAAAPGAPRAAPTAADPATAVALALPPWVARHFHEPGPAINRMDDWAAKLDAIIERTWNLDISMLAGLPEWALALTEQMRSRIDGGTRGLVHLQSLWPRLDCFVHGGTALGPFARPLHEALGPQVAFHEVYAAAEGFIAAQDADGAAGLRLLTDAGIFFEFVPVAEFNEARPAASGPRALSLAEAKPGVDYALLLTTPGGLVRYALGDTVRFVSVDPPRLLWVGRTSLGLNVVGERVVEKEVTDALVNVCDRHAWRIVDYHVAPLLAASSMTNQRRARHEWWVELRAGTNETPTGPILGAGVDRELQAMNPFYAAKRRTGALDLPVVRLVIPGVFEHSRRRRRQWGGLHKMPRCAADRRIADDLADLTRFTADTQAPWGG